MTTSYAVLGQFGDAIRFIFEGQTSTEGTHVGGSQFLDLLWEHLKLTLRGHGRGVRDRRSRSGSGSGTSAGPASWRSASRTSAARCPASP